MLQEGPHQSRAATDLCQLRGDPRLKCLARLQAATGHSGPLCIRTTKRGRESLFGKVDFLALLAQVQRLLGARAGFICSPQPPAEIGSWDGSNDTRLTRLRREPRVPVSQQ